METLKVVDFGSVITDRSVGDIILRRVRGLLKTDHKVCVDFSNVITMATYCAKQIFGTLYIELNPQNFFDRIIISNASDDIKALIQLGIMNALEED